ncbi:hypothetical protein FRB99_000356 [Tulasnella sp. 403]|nr:hypothetical protein FRB99_000356 [Tulasnella sp. 403]
MQLLKSLALVTVFLTSALANNPAPGIPKLYYVGSGQLTSASPNPVQINSPLGLRISNPFSGGFVNDKNGHRIGKALGGYGVENGRVDTNSLIHIDTRSTWVLADGNYAFVTFQGLGPLGQTGWFQFGVETGSSAYSYLNKMYILGNNTITGQTLKFDLYSPIAPPS